MLSIIFLKIDGSMTGDFYALLKVISDDGCVIVNGTSFTVGNISASSVSRT